MYKSVPYYSDFYFFVAERSPVFTQSVVKCRFAHTAQFRRFARPDGSAFPSLHNIGKVIRCLNHRSAKFHPVCLCRRNSLGLSLSDIFTLILRHKGQHLKHNICKEGAHQIFTPPRIEQRHIYDRNIHFFLSRQIAPLTLYILVIPSKTVNAEDLYPSVFYNNLNIQKKDDRLGTCDKAGAQSGFKNKITK